MFTATQYEFRSSPDVRRNFPFPTLRTEEAPTRWLLGKCKGNCAKAGKVFANPNLFFSLASHIVSKETLFVRLLLVLCVSLVYRGRFCGLGAAEGELQQLCR